jgi:hypothetical protein
LLAAGSERADVLMAAIMRSITSEGFEVGKADAAGPAPMLQWIKISDLVVDPSYQRPIVGEGKRNVDRIARDFRWAFFAPVVVSPVEGGRFAIIDGQHRTTAAAVVGIETIPCQVVIAARNEQAAAFKAINGLVTPISRMALHVAALVAKEPRAVEVAEVCASADVELLRYPVPLERQVPGQTMAVGAIEACSKRYGRDTLGAALRCITRTSNNVPGALNARIIKALCLVLHENPAWLRNGRELLRAFDAIDLARVQEVARRRAAEKGAGLASVIAEELREQIRLAMRMEAAE